MVTATHAGELNVRVGCEFHYESFQLTPAVFVVRPEVHTAQHRVREQWETEPALPYHDFLDLYGNACRRLSLPPGNFSLRYDAVVRTSGAADPQAPGAVQHAVQDLPDDALVYTMPSRFCLSDLVFDRAQELFGASRPGWWLVQAICDWVHTHVTFTVGASDSTTTALEVLHSGAGVCRDYAHLAITFCRAMNIPARYVFGYLPDIDVAPPYPEMDFCAWFEAYLGGAWWTFDPRNNEPRKGRIVIARGRDALDVAMVTTYGAPRLQRMTVWAQDLREGGYPE